MKNMKYVVSILLLIVSVCVRSQSNNNLPPYRELIADCNTYIVPPTEYYQQSNLFKSEYYQKYNAISQNDMMAYLGKSALDGLDKELYKQSDQYKDDLALFQKKKQEKYALMLNIWKSETNVTFDADGIVFPDDWCNYPSKDIGILNYYIEICGLLFPVQSVRTSNNYLKFKTTDLQLLQHIKLNNKNLSVLFIFKPSLCIPYEPSWSHYFHVTAPIGIYVVNNATGETLADFSKIIRKTTFQVEKNRVQNSIRKYQATQRTNAPKKHSTPKQERCAYCGGQGYIEYFPVGSATLTKTRCTNCYGKGYTLEYYY